MKFNKLIYLLGVADSTDDAGNAISSMKKRKVFASELSVSNRLLLQAQAEGLKPEILLRIRDFEYNGEKKVLYKDKEFDVINNTRSDEGIVTLTIGGVINVTS